MSNCTSVHTKGRRNQQLRRLYKGIGKFPLSQNCSLIFFPVTIPKGMKMAWGTVLKSVALLLCCAQGVVSDWQCTGRRGTCQYTSTRCAGSYVSGLCNGPSTRKCCVPGTSGGTSYNDARCTSRGGTCQYTTTSCRGGSYVSGLCGGPTNRRCCVPGSSSGGSGSCSGVTIVSRSQWGARSPRSISRMRTPVSLVFIHHTDGATCSSVTSCSRVMRGVQNYHMDTRGYTDIGYSFLVGGDGKIYEGRGWDRVGAHTKNYNSRAIAISFMGDFMSQSPTQSALRAAQDLISCGVRSGKVSAQYRLYGHRQARGASTSCPGNRLYSIIQGWSGYSSGTAP